MRRRITVSLFGWRTVIRAAREARHRRPGRRGDSVRSLGPAVAGGLVVGLLLSGCVGPTAAPAGTDPAAGAGGPASAASPGGASRPEIPPASEVATPPPTTPPEALPAVPRQSTDLAGQPAPASAPVRVQVDALGIDMAIEAVGLDGAAMALPANPAVAAWYRYGPAPGSAEGATVVAAHVDSLIYDLGPFAELAAAPAGTEITVTTADGAAHRYTIAAIDTVEKPAVDWAGVFDRAGPPRLTLVTCGGEFDYETRHYLSNVIVTAVPAP